MRFFGVHYKAAREVRRAVRDADFGVPFPSVHDDGRRPDRAIALRTTAPPQTLFVTPPTARVAGRKVGEIRSAGQLDQLVRRYLGVRL